MKKLLAAVTAFTITLGGAWANAEDVVSPPQANGKEAVRPHHGGMMGMMDTDKNGIVSHAEHEAFTALRFKTIDANGDGNLTQEEMQKHRQAKWGDRRHHDCEDKNGTPPKE